MISPRALVKTLSQCQLLSPDRLGQLAKAAYRWRGDPRPLVKKLVQRGWLTVYQANQLLAGRGQQLVLGPYHILDRLGQGGLSQVFKARHPGYGWTVALKVIRPEIFTFAEGRAQFLLEMEAMTLLDHPNIVQFCDADQAGDTFYFAMEYVEGIDLGKLVRLSGFLSVRSACEYVRQTALGLQHAHEHNLVHRDIKPANLFLTAIGHRPSAIGQESAPGALRPIAGSRQPAAVVKILDWGLASLCLPGNGHATSPEENSSGGVLGTVDYLSPEQARNPQTVDIRSDIYSLGCTLYFLLTGLPPFPLGTVTQKCQLHKHAEPKPVASFRPDVPPEVMAILKRMLAKKPQERFQTPAAVALALAPFARREQRPKAVSPPVLRRRFRRSFFTDDTPMSGVLSN